MGLGLGDRFGGFQGRSGSFEEMVLRVSTVPGPVAPADPKGDGSDAGGVLPLLGGNGQRKPAVTFRELVAFEALVWTAVGAALARLRIEVERTVRRARHRAGRPRFSAPVCGLVRRLPSGEQRLMRR